MEFNQKFSDYLTLFAHSRKLRVRIALIRPKTKKRYYYMSKSKTRQKRFAAIIPVVPTGISPNALPVTHQTRRLNNWCWAAVGSMVLELSNISPGSQCDLADHIFPHLNCCSDYANIKKACDQPCSVSQIEQMYHAFQLPKAKLHQSHISYGGQGLSIQSEIGQGRPVQIGWRSTGSFSSGHTVLAYDWIHHNNVDYVWISDPSPIQGYGWIAYSELLTARGTGKWAWTWTNLR